MRNDKEANRDAALLDAAAKYPHKGAVRIEAGVIVEEGDPTNALNLLVRSDEIHALALFIKASRGRA